MQPPSPYLQRRMAQRQISEQEIDEALDNVTTSYSSHDGRTVVLGVTNSGRRLKVVVLDSDPGYVVTVADRDNED